jgi:hypothetical protein
VHFALAWLPHHQSCRGERLNATGLPRFSQHHDSRSNSITSFRQRQQMCEVDNNHKASVLVILGMPNLVSCPWRQAWRLEVRRSRGFQPNTAGAHCWHATGSMMLASLAASCSPRHLMNSYLCFRLVLSSSSISRVQVYSWAGSTCLGWLG